MTELGDLTVPSLRLLSRFSNPGCRRNYVARFPHNLDAMQEPPCLWLTVVHHWPAFHMLLSKFRAPFLIYKQPVLLKKKFIPDPDPTLRQGQVKMINLNPKLFGSGFRIRIRWIRVRIQEGNHKNRKKLRNFMF